MAVRSGVPGIAQGDGLEIAYESTGEGEPALVFITGGFEDRSYFDPQVARFAGERRVVTVEVRGHGRSSVPSEATIDSFVRDVLAVAEAAEIRSAVLCGH